MTTAGPLSKRLDRLFQQRRHPEGRRFTVGEVAAATGLSTSYLRYLLSGQRDNPSMANIAVLAAFFAVSPGYFFADGDVPDLLRCGTAVRCPATERLGDLVTRLRAMSGAELTVVDEFVDRLLQATRVASVTARFAGHGTTAPLMIGNAGRRDP